MKVTILLATFNGDKFIREQIESILSQTYTNWELLIHDDGSTDSTPVILNEYSLKYPDKIKILVAPPTGCAKNNFLLLMNHADSNYIMFCDQDDVWHQDKIEKTLVEMQSVEKELSSDTPILIFSESRVVDENLKEICPMLSKYQNLDCNRTSLSKLLLQNVATGCTMMINSSLLGLAKVKNTDSIKMHDWWCALIASKFGVLSFISEPLVDYRQHSDNSVGALNVNSPKYIKNKLSKTDKIKADLFATRIQAKRFAEEFNDSFAMDYFNLASQSKLSRLVFYVKNDIWKKGFTRNILLFIFG